MVPGDWKVQAVFSRPKAEPGNLHFGQTLT